MDSGNERTAGPKLILKQITGKVAKTGLKIYLRLTDLIKALNGIKRVRKWKIKKKGIQSKISCGYKDSVL